MVHSDVTISNDAPSARVVKIGVRVFPYIAVGSKQSKKMSRKSHLNTTIDKGIFLPLTVRISFRARQLTCK